MDDTNMAYELIPGVRQDHRGARYFFARYPNGKLIHIQALGADALRALEPARMIPIIEQRRAAKGGSVREGPEAEQKPTVVGGPVRTGVGAIS